MESQEHEASEEQTSRNSNTDCGEVPEAPPLAEELLEVNGESLLFGGMALVGCPFSSGWSDTHAYIGSINYTQ